MPAASSQQSLNETTETFSLLDHKIYASNNSKQKISEMLSLGFHQTQMGCCSEVLVRSKPIKIG
jgi:hypothetical protein